MKDVIKKGKRTVLSSFEAPCCGRCMTNSRGFSIALEVTESADTYVLLAAFILAF